jgi:hypothetical protein
MRHFLAGLKPAFSTPLNESEIGANLFAYPLNGDCSMPVQMNPTKHKSHGFFSSLPRIARKMRALFLPLLGVRRD